MAADKGANQSVEKAITVLETFAGGEPMRVSDVAREAGIGQSTASRLLATLEAGGLVERDPQTSLYFLGAELMTLAGIAINQNRVHRVGRQIAQSLAGELGLGVNIALLRGAELVYLCNFEGRLSPKSHTLMGQRVPLHATSIGKATLMGSTREKRLRLLPELPGFTEATITTHDALDREVAVTTRRGYAIEVEEFVLGRASTAAPILDRTGRIVAAISISGPLTAVDLEARASELGRTVVETADRISSGLGYQGPAG
ncbi:IclR family transcriptional regulator [Microbacterium oleivorans]|uniref:Glycerol operon regulatory protein n=1 Tax=Microbacterium oleivorans TaxID=273677 RepID=A0A7D5IQ51_9MICO|nr:IclR family transcriptional regulator [Microbacterium oleivorans]QLD11999.1 IclR family transcriptional regulator [Microbacterium oleivorans]